jgi:hypothetical protein
MSAIARTTLQMFQQADNITSQGRKLASDRRKVCIAGD